MVNMNPDRDDLGHINGTKVLELHFYIYVSSLHKLLQPCKFEKVDYDITIVRALFDTDVSYRLVARLFQAV